MSQPDRLKPAAPEAERWRDYYRRVQDRPPRRTLLTAVDLFPTGFAGQAVDLGCGGGRDVVPLLRLGWAVHAIDAQASAIEELRRNAAYCADRLTTAVGPFENAAWPACDLVNSSFALPLCPPDRFPGLWQRIGESLRPGGRFSGQLYGERDSWQGRPGITTLARPAAEALLDGWMVDLFEEEESDGVTPRGTPKHWHIFHIVARRP